jgi:hypothetical protein
MRPYLQNNKRKRAGGVAQVVDHQFSKCESLSLNSTAAKNKGKEIKSTGSKPTDRDESKSAASLNSENL